MKHFLAFIRLQSANHDDQTPIKILAQPAGQRRDIDPIANRFKFPYLKTGQILRIGNKRLFQFHIQMQRLFPAPSFKSTLPRVISKNPRLLDRLRRTGSAKFRRAIRSDRDQRSALIVSFDDRRQQFRRRRSAGRHDRTRQARLHRPSEREKSGTAFFKMSPNFHQTRAFRPRQRFEQRRISSSRTHHKITNA